jgi:hypothetical protein
MQPNTFRRPCGAVRRRGCLPGVVSAIVLVLLRGVSSHKATKLPQYAVTAGVHFIQVAKWLGHSSYVLTLTTYADYIPEVETENPLPEPVAAPANANVVPLKRRARR